MIKRGLFILTFIILFTSLASAEIIIHNKPNEIYSLGESSQISVTVKSLTGATNIFQMNLICEGQIIPFYQNGISLSAGQEKKIEASLIFTKSLIGEAKGTCLIKAIFGEEYALTDEFTVSSRINLLPDMEITTFTPGTSAIIKGNAITEDGQTANGFINLEIVAGNQSSSINEFETIRNGFFSINVSFPKDMKAGRYLLKLNAYEEEFGNGQTNTGFTNYNIEIIQIPTSLEIILEEGIEPGTSAQIRVVLHDQTGENIESIAKITVKDNKTRIIEQIEKPTNEDLEILIVYNENPSTWTISAESNGLSTEKTFLILEKKDIEISLLNNTVTITNTGNVFYNNSVTVKIGDETRFIDVALNVDESQEYKLTAPNGEYEVTIIEEGGKELVQRVTLTGRAVSAKEKKSGSRLIFSFAWIFIILILGFVAHMFFKKGYKKTFFGFMPSFRKKEKTNMKTIPLRTSSKLTSKNPAVVSLSIKGDKQKATTTCLHIKNLKEIEGTKNNAEETLQKIINFAEEHKALTYQNQENLYFILAPIKTRTFKNEQTALEIAQAAKKVLTEHNKLFKQKIESGLSINNGVIIAKPEKDSTKFMSMGTFITTAKKTASTSNGEILFSGEVRDKLRSEVKAEKLKDQEDVYYIKEVKKYSQENKKFIENFVRKLEKEKK